MTNEKAREILNILKEYERAYQYSKEEVVGALDMANKALEQTRWIPVSEGLPEPNRLVLCYITTGTSETYFLALWNDIQNSWEEGIGGSRLLEDDLEYEVIAWMPLPQPYKAESEDKE